jgi:glycosyltransferase involved in cell wall biosynthesis
MKISACIITYNHEPFLRKCLDGAISQKLNCEYEIIIGEDCSTDKTLDICKEYQLKYPNIIKLLPSNKNHGMIGNWLRTISECKGKYIAICEGDDYWTDPNKLQTQFDIMETNSEYSFTFHNVSVKNEIKSINYSYPTPSKKILAFNDILKKHYIPTCSVFFRREMYPKPEPDFLIHCLIGDIPVQLLLSSRGDVFFLDKKMATYRKNQNGITLNTSHLAKGRKGYVYVYFNLLKYLFPRYFFPLSYKLSLTILGFIKDRFK